MLILLSPCWAAGGLCGPGVASFDLLWEEAVEKLDAVASAVSVCTLSAARCARSLGGRMVEICVRSVRGLFVRSWGTALGNICRRCLPPASSGLLSSSARRVTRRAAEGGLRLWCLLPADLLDPNGGLGVRGECCPVALSGARSSPWSGPGWVNGRSGLHCGSHGGATWEGRLCWLCNWLVRATCLAGRWVVGNH